MSDLQTRNTLDPTRADFAGPCPRCGGGVPNSLQPGAHPGVRSRVDRITYLCTSCGEEEAIYQFVRASRGEPIELPPVTQPIVFGGME